MKLSTLSMFWKYQKQRLSYSILTYTKNRLTTVLLTMPVKFKIPYIKEENPMKKAIYVSLFAVALLGSGTVSAFADEVVTGDNNTSAIADPVEPIDPTDPIDPIDPVEPIDPTEPVDPGDGGGTTDPTEPVDPGDGGGTTDPTEPVDPGDGGETTDPTEPVDPGDGGETTDPTEPVDPGDGGGTTDPTESTKPTEPEKPVKPSEPAKPVDVVVTPSGEISDGGNKAQQPTVPIVTSNVKEITHVPTPSTPLVIASGETVVAVQDGTPLKQTAEGLKPIQSDFKVLPSGNVQVKDSAGKLKVLPKTGEESTLLLALLGNLLVFMSLFFVFKKNKHEKEVGYSFVGNETQELKNEQAKYEFFVRATNIGKRKLKNLQRAINGFIFRND